MIRPRLARWLPLVLLSSLLFAACDSGDPDDERLGISGSWTGDLIGMDSTGAELRYPVTMTLSDNINRVTGSGQIQLPTETLTFDVPTGLYAPPNLSLELIFDRPPQGTISGIVSPERDFIDATLSGPGDANGPVEFSLVMQRME